MVHTIIDRSVIYQSRTYDFIVAVLTLVFFSGFWFSLNTLFFHSYGFGVELMMNGGLHTSVDDEYLLYRLCLKHSPDTVTLQRDERFPYLVLSPKISVIAPKRLFFHLFFIQYLNGVYAFS